MATHAKPITTIRMGANEHTMSCTLGNMTHHVDFADFDAKDRRSALETYAAYVCELHDIRERTHATHHRAATR